ncbi:hypothetical protein DYB28_005176 [Aphanomyces astaci]|uniref:Protein kinase domain-containing protein n=2 Tax=Aphanomyces astaci TaxID=112090 RepID=A0A9X8DPG9_APHAT|nr:hypothetical protein DYB28_005176 [Aphanomyces astaci]
MLAKGTILKNWVVGDKLGSGACSDVYAVTSKSNSAESFAMKLSPIPPPSKSKKKTHAARSADALYAEHLLYVNTLQGIPGIPALPTTGAYGEDKGYRFLVIQRLGPVHFGHGGPQAVQNWRGGRHPHVFKRPLPLRRQYDNPPPRLFVVVMMTPLAPSRRDDLEALLYVCLYLIRGDLPWQSASSDAEGARIKAECDPDHLCASLAGSTIAPALTLSTPKASASSSPTDDGKENKATSAKKGGVKRKDPPSSTKTPPQPDVVDVDLEKKRKEPSERRKKAASRAVGALAAASAAVTRARRTRSTTQAELQ